MQKWLGGAGNGAAYATEFGENLQPAVIKLVQADARESNLQLGTWEAISRISHENLIRLFDAGRCDIDGVSLLYVVMEWAEENLADVLAERSLTPAETRDMLEALLRVLLYLHERAFLHGGIKPSNIMASGDQVKLSSDSIMGIGQVNVYPTGSNFDPPELKDGIVSSAIDVWMLGVTLVQALTQRPPNLVDLLDEVRGDSKLAVVANLPEPFADIVRHCIQLDPQARWSIQEIASRLSARLPTEDHAPPPPAIYSDNHRQVRRRAYIFAGAALAMLAVFVLVDRKQSHSLTSTAAPAFLPSPGPGATQGLKHDTGHTMPSPEPRRPNTAVPGRRNWRSAENWYVIAATYNQRESAEKRANAIARRWPNFEIQVFSPELEKTRYLVVIGAKLSEKAAVALQKRALAAGLPPDTYVKRFSE